MSCRHMVRNCVLYDPFLELRFSLKPMRNAFLFIFSLPETVPGSTSKDTLTLKIKQNALKPRRNRILFDFQGQMLLWEGASKDTLTLKIKQNALKPRRNRILFDFQGQLLLWEGASKDTLTLKIKQNASKRRRNLHFYLVFWRFRVRFSQILLHFTQV